MARLKELLIGCCSELDTIQSEVKLDYYGMSTILQSRHGIGQKRADQIIEYWFQRWRLDQCDPIH